MGTLAESLSETSTAFLGRELWAEHLKTISQFWNSIAQFFQIASETFTKIYQDGLVAEGVEGLKIIEAGVKQGSQNYQIIAGLLQKGGVLVKTEDIGLVQKEYNFIKKLTAAKTNRERETAALRYKLAQQKLLADRDSYIGRTIDASLTEGDKGVLFIGAYHQVLTKLAPDIQIVQIKEIARVLEYHKLLSNLNVKTKGRYQQLAEYMAAPVKISGIGQD
jgi:hypothetical protein